MLPLIDMASDSQVDSILDRRRQLKRQRRNRALQSTWRTFFALASLTGLLWTFSQAQWQIQDSSNLTITGTEPLAPDILVPFLPKQFPVSLLRFQLAEVTTTVTENTHVARLEISRHLFPARATIRVAQVRPAVASTTCNQCVLVVRDAQQNLITLGPSNVWLLDELGIPLPLAAYPQAQQAGQFPALTVNQYLVPVERETDPDASADIVVQPDPEKQTWWRSLYPLLSRERSIQVTALDLQDRNNLQLKTDLGLVYLGPYSAKLTEQLQVLEKMRGLPEIVDPQKISYIDLRNPQQPTLERRDAIPLPTAPPSP
ncbi:hypothetical protein GS597_08780 [Synechococcales cyanobacterium C]|uniref:Cell division protein FtsQ n=1 Tax=Petrachloros mirabilis ULC683 TaxID=2781853 RepID=A0A8K1ZZ31_9CYAN|nr:hypothetical protein [Petrachloros mirabilis]NCJ06596.1 hypothetical protein [Petrachloros mirabilis ULC683]